MVNNMEKAGRRVSCVKIRIVGCATWFKFLDGESWFHLYGSLFSLSFLILVDELNNLEGQSITEKVVY